MMSAAAFKPWGRGYLHPFWDGSRFWYGVGEKSRTLTELAMCGLSAEFRSRDSWWDDYQHEYKREEWIHHHAGRLRNVEAPSGVEPVALNANQVKYVVDELAGYSTLRDKKHECQVSCFERIWESSTLLTSDLGTLIDSELQVLRNNSLAMTPGDVTIDIIDPYAYPVRYNETLIISPEGQIHTASPSLPLLFDGYTLSTRFACLPTAFSVSTSDQPLTCHALSYINNIHPTHTSLYKHIETLLAKSVPLLEHVLTDLHRDNPLHQRIQGSCAYEEWNEPEEPEHSDDDEGWANYDREMRTWILQRPISLPDIPGTGYPGGLEKRRTIVSLHGRTLKVILKVTDIHLTPERSHHPGTPWQAVGMRNEHVVASVFHCISLDNITTPHMAFRMPICSPRKFTSGDEGATMRTWGLRHGYPGTQSLGQARFTLGRSVAFPNVYQHSLMPIELIDPERKGSVTILSFSLVDPDIFDDPENGIVSAADRSEVLTTCSIPPQQRWWMREALEACLDVRIPNEVVERILHFVDGVMTDEEARDVAREMAREREWFRVSHARHWFNLPFDVWSGDRQL